MNRLEFAALAREQALQVHQAARIVRDDVIRAGLGGVGAFHVAHRGGNHWELRGERAAETAARLDFRHFNQFQTADFCEQFARRFFHAEFAQAVAAVVKRDLVRKFRAEIGHTEFLHEKFGKFPGARGDLFRQFRLRRVLEQFGIKILQHRAARTRSDDDDFRVFQLPQNFRGDGARLVPIAGIERRLAAADDFFGTNNFVAEAFENFDHADARAREQRVHETGDEKRDGHSIATQMRTRTLFTR
jgi:hypothetical protein